MTLYKVIPPQESLIERNTSYEGETMEQRIERILNNNEPVTDGAPPIYTTRTEGVQPQYNIRTDRFEIALEAFDNITKGWLAKREEYHKPPEPKPAPEPSK